ncbi:putative quinol monooxygenase [Thalassomonas actiniarum]|nr:antibiotic biosynthesis monooxygenase [Thalassomonas actiniarum]
MSRMTTFAFEAKPGQSEALLSFFKKILPGTRSFSGNNGAELSCLSESEFMIITYWQQEQNLELYLSWREKKGDFAILLSFLNQAPEIVTYEVLEGI